MSKIWKNMISSVVDEYHTNWRDSCLFQIEVQAIDFWIMIEDVLNNVYLSRKRICICFMRAT